MRNPTHKVKTTQKAVQSSLRANTHINSKPKEGKQLVIEISADKLNALPVHSNLQTICKQTLLYLSCASLY